MKRKRVMTHSHSIFVICFGINYNVLVFARIIDVFHYQDSKTYAFKRILMRI